MQPANIQDDLTFAINHRYDEGMLDHIEDLIEHPEELAANIRNFGIHESLQNAIINLLFEVPHNLDSAEAFATLKNSPILPVKYIISSFDDYTIKNIIANCNAKDEELELLNDEAVYFKEDLQEIVEFLQEILWERSPEHPINVQKQLAESISFPSYESSLPFIDATLFKSTAGLLAYYNRTLELGELSSANIDFFHKRIAILNSNPTILNRALERHIIPELRGTILHLLRNPDTTNSDLLNLVLSANIPSFYNLIKSLPAVEIAGMIGGHESEIKGYGDEHEGFLYSIALYLKKVLQAKNREDSEATEAAERPLYSDSDDEEVVDKIIPKKVAEKIPEKPASTPSAIPDILGSTDFRPGARVIKDTLTITSPAATAPYETTVFGQKIIVNPTPKPLIEEEEETMPAVTVAAAPQRSSSYYSDLAKDDATPKAIRPITPPQQVSEKGGKAQ